MSPTQGPDEALAAALPEYEVAPSVFVVILPSAGADAWRHALSERVADGGLPHMEILTDAHGLDHIDPSRLVVVMTEPTTACEEAVGLPLTEASRLLAQASDLPGSTTFLTDADGPAFALFSQTINVPAKPMGERQANGATAALALFAKGPPPIGQRAEWPIDIFTLDAKASANGDAPGALELVGRARCLLHGPYVWLPRGGWRVTVRFSVDGPASERNLRFEWGGSDAFAHMNVSPRKAGHYEAQLTHVLDEAQPMELRAIIPESALAGRLAIESIEVERVAVS